MSDFKEEIFTVKDTKQLRKYLEKFDKRIDDFPNTTISSHQLERMINQLQKLHDFQNTIDVKTILHEVTKASIFSVKEIEYNYILTHGTKFQLKDGTQVLIRPLIPTDKERLRTEHLSLDTLFLRFMSPIRYLSESQLNYLTDVDLIDHFAIGILLDQPNYPGIAVARYIRDYKDSTIAEWAITVIDQYQGQRIGPILLYTLSQIALLNGIKEFRCTIHPTNQRMIQWMMKIGAYRIGFGNEYDFYEDLYSISEQYAFSLPISTPLIHNQELQTLLDDACHGKGNLDSECVKDCFPEEVHTSESPLYSKKE